MVMVTKCNPSKKALQDAICTLMQTKNIGQVTVADILRESQVSRPTFYRHFADKYALANSIYDRDIVPIREAYLMSKDFLALSKSTYVLFDKNRVFYKQLLCNSEAQNSFFQYWAESNYKYMAQEINRNLINDEIKVALYMFCYGSMHVTWDIIKNNNGLEIEAELVGEYVIKSMPEVLKPFFQIMI